MGVVKQSVIWLFVLSLAACGGGGGGGDNTQSNSAPIASNVIAIDDNGSDAVVGDTLTGSYTYTDADGDTEGSSTFQWLRNSTAINGATGSTYTIASADIGQTISFEVTPIASTGTLAGNAVASTAISNIIAPPASPQNLQAITSTQQIIVSWDAVANASSYKLYWNTTGNVTTNDSVLVAGADTHFIHNNLSIGTTYYYRAVAVTSVTEGSLSDEITASPTIEGWAWANPKPQGNTITDMATFGDLFVAIGDGGTILTSNDGSSWLRQVSGTKEDLSRIYATGSRLVAVGNYGTLLTSTDALTWSAPTLPISSSTHLAVITYTGTEWISAGTEFITYQQFEAPVIRSADGITWLGGTTVLPTSISPTSFRGLASNATHIVAVDSSGRIYRTNDVTTSNWTLVHDAAGAYGFSNITYADNQFVAVGWYDIIYTSPDGLTWTQQTSNTNGYPLFDITHNGAEWVVVGSNGRVLKSSDAISWTNHTATSSTSNLLYAAAFNNIQNKWAAAGVDMISSLDAINWDNHSASVSRESIYDVAYDGNQYIAVTFSAFLKSTNGINWTTQSFGAGVSGLYAIDYSNGTWVAVGWNGNILTSTDGNSWTTQTSGTTNQLNDVAYDGTQWLSVSSTGAILTSPDAVTWSPQNSGVSEFLYGASHDGSQWVVVGLNGTILTSTNATTWTPQTTGTTSSLSGVSHNGSQWIVVGSGGTILSSNDGTTWTTQNSGFPNNFNDITYTGTQWIAVGGYGQSVTSLDGITWNVEDIPYGRELNAIISSGSLLVAVGESGTVLIRTP